MSAQRPIVIAHHLMWTNYGWWLPNDPRGSTSRTIRCDVIADLGKLHHGRKELQPASKEIRQFYARAGEVLKHPLIEFGAGHLPLVAAGLAEAVAEHCYTCYACAVLPDHVHVLIRKHKHLAEDMIPNLQRASRLRLGDSRAVPADHPVWGGPGWKVFLDHPDDIRRTIRYIEKNPVKLRLPPQRWPFVQDYDGWPLHPGHSPNSPYAKRLRNHRG